MALKTMDAFLILSVSILSSGIFSVAGTMVREYEFMVKGFVVFHIKSNSEVDNIKKIVLNE